jgi:hypothetical protein
MSRCPPSDPLLHAMFRRDLAAGLQRRDLAGWMRAHRAEVEVLLKQGEMDWEAAARHFAAAGLLVDGQEPDARTAEETWQRVRLRHRPKPQAPRPR